MIQSGILYTIDSTTGQATNKPLKGAWINFVQNDVIKVRTQTHGETGAYSVDVPFGKYTVNLAVGNVTVTMRAGQLFELKSGDNASAFQNWLYSTTADVDDTLLNSFKQIANDISDSANRAENAATEAQQIQQQMQNNSIGDANGMWMKEGASKSDFLKTFGKYYTPSMTVPMLVDGMSGLATPSGFSENNSGLDLSGLGLGSFVYFEVQKNYASNRLLIEFKGYNSPILAQSVKLSDEVWSKPVAFWSTGNTTVDSNGNIKKASPIIKLFDDHIEYNDQFKEVPIFEKIDIGTYKISNTLGLAKGIEQGDWYIETPKNRNGLPYFMVEWEQCPETDEVIIRCFERKFDIEIGDFVNGELKDIGKDERWIDLRFHEEIEEHEIIE